MFSLRSEADLYTLKPDAESRYVLDDVMFEVMWCCG